MSETVDFTGFVSGLAASAFVTIQQIEALAAPPPPDAAEPEDTAPEPGAGGEDPPPEERDQQIRNGLLTVRHLIGTLAMLEEKTRGNLSADEAQVLQTSLTQLRFAYVRAAEGAPKPAS